MPQWYDITRKAGYQDLTPEDQSAVKQRFFERYVLPEIDNHPELKGDEDARKAAYIKFMQSPDDTGQGVIKSTLGGAARGLGEIVPGAIQGAGALTGISPLEKAGEAVRSGLEYVAPVNPLYQESFPVKAAGVVGQIGSVLGTAGVGGIAGKALAAERIAAGATAAEQALLASQAINRGANAALYGSAALQGAASGAQTADQYGLTGANRYGNILAGAGIEMGTELLPFGIGAETAAAKKLLGAVPRAGRFAGDVASEAGEEFTGQIAQNAALAGLAPTGTETPSLMEGAVEAGLYGGLGGGILGGVNVASGAYNKQATLPPPVQEAEIAAEVGLQEAAAADAPVSETAKAYNDMLAAMQRGTPATAETPSEVEQRLLALQNEPIATTSAGDIIPANPATEDIAGIGAAESGNVSAIPGVESTEEVESPPSESLAGNAEVVETPNAPRITELARQAAARLAGTEQGPNLNFPQTQPPQTNANEIPSATPLPLGETAESSGRVREENSEGQEVAGARKGQEEVTRNSLQRITPKRVPSKGFYGEVKDSNGNHVGDLWKDKNGDFRVYFVEYGKILAESPPIPKNLIKKAGGMRLSAGQSVQFYKAFLPKESAGLADKEYQPEPQTPAPQKPVATPEMAGQSSAQAVKSEQPAEASVNEYREYSSAPSESPAGLSERRRTVTENLVESAKKTASAYASPAYIVMRRETQNQASGEPRVSRTKDGVVLAIVRENGKVELQSGAFRPKPITPPTEKPTSIATKGQTKPMSGDSGERLYTVYKLMDKAGKKKHYIPNLAPMTQQEALTFRSKMMEPASWGLEDVTNQFTQESSDEARLAQKMQPVPVFSPAKTPESPEKPAPSEKVEAGNAALDEMLSELSPAIQAKWTPEIRAKAEKYFETGNYADLDGLTIVQKTKINEALLKSNKEAEAAQKAADKLYEKKLREEEKENARLEKERAEQEKLTESRRGTYDSIIGAPNGVEMNAVSPADGQESLALVHNSGDVPGVLNAFVGTSKEFLANPQNEKDFPELFAILKNGRVDEGNFAYGRAFVFTDGIGVNASDRANAAKLGVTPAVAAVRRVLVHESLVHRGIYGLPARLKMQILQWVKQNTTPEQLDALAAIYPQYENWRNNEAQMLGLCEELLAKTVDKMTKLPTSGPLARLVEILKDIWRWITGNTGEPTIKNLKDVVKLLKAGVEAADSRLVNGGGIKMSQLRAQGFVTPEMDKVYMAAVEAGDMAKVQRMVDEADAARLTRAQGRRAEIIKALPPESNKDTVEGAVARYSAVRELLDTFTVPVGFTLEGAGASGGGSIYVMARDVMERDADGSPLEFEDFKLSIRNHEPSPFREKEFGKVNKYEEVEDPQNPHEVAEAITKLEQWLDKKGYRQDPVTRDDAGNVIPLSQRFNPAKADIRESRVSYANPLDAQLASAAERMRAMREKQVPQEVDAQFIRNEIRKAYDTAIQGQGSIQASLQQVYDIAKEAIPTLTEKQFGEQVQALYEDGSAFLVPTDRSADMLAAGEKWGVFDVAGLPASYLGVMPSQETTKVYATPIDRNAIKNEVEKSSKASLDEDSLKGFILRTVAMYGQPSRVRMARLDMDAPLQVNPQPNGELVIGLGAGQAGEIIRNSSSPRAGFKYLADAIEEEMIHFADYLAIRSKWEVQGSSGSFTDFIKRQAMDLSMDLIQVADTLSASDKEAFRKALAASLSSYRNDALWNDAALEDILQAYAETPMAANAELIRALIQAKRSGDITATGYQRIANTLVKWLKDALNWLQQAYGQARNGGFGNMLAQRIQDTEKQLEMLAAGEKWGVFDVAGLPASYIGVLPSEIKASRVENTQVPKAIDSTNGFADAIDAIKTASPTLVESQARALKDHLPDDHIQQGVEPRVAVSIALIDRLLKSGIPAIELPSILNSPAFLDSLGISENADMQQYLAIEALNRINLAAIDSDSVSDRTNLVKQADGAAKIWNLLGEFGGRSLGTRGWLMKHPRYAAMFVEQGILSNLTNQSENVTKANIVDPNAVVKGAEKASETAKEAATNQSDKDLVDSWMDAAEETLSPKAKGLFDRIREKLARIGYLMGLSAKTKQSVAGNLAARFAQEYKGITQEKIESELEKLRKEVEADLSAFADELLGKDAPQEAKTKVKKTAEKAAKREKKKKPTAEDKAKKKQERASAVAQRLIYRTEEVFRQGFKNEAKSKNADSILKAFRDQVKEPVSDAAFTARLKKLNVTEEVAARMLKTAARERGDQEQIKKNALLDSVEALKKIMHKLSGKLGIFQIDPTSWRKLFSTSNASQAQRKVEMQEAIKADPAFSKLDGDEQKQLADLLDEAWQAKHDEVLKTEINRLTRTNKMSDKAKDAINEAIPEIIQMVNRGTFDNAELAKIVSSKFGFRELTAEERGRLREITEKLQQDIPPWEHKRLANELRELLADVTKLNFAELAEAWWVSSVLSGPRTAFTIGLGFNSGGFEVIKNSFGTILLNPTNLNAWDASFKAIKGWLSSMPREAQRALVYLKTGDVTLLDSSMSNDAALIDRAVKELGSVGVAAKLLKSKNPVARKAGQFMAFMQKLLQALDMFNGYTAKYAGMPLAYFHTQSVYDPKELDTIRNHSLSRQQVLVSEFGGIEPTSLEDKARLNAWATDKMWKDIKRLGGLEENANYLAQQANMTLDPTGVGGIFYHTILGIQASQKKKSADFVQKQKEELLNADGIEKQIAKFNLALGYIYQFAAHNFLGALGLKFARFGGSKLNQTLSFIPIVGLARLAEKTDAQKMHMINVAGAQSIGFFLLGQALWILSQIADEPDDDKRGWDIQGNWGNVSPERKQQLLAAGKREYTIFYKGKRYSYANWPISGMLSAIGSMADLIRYSPDQWNEKSVANRLASGVWAAAASVGDSAALSQLSELLGTSMASRDPIEASMGKFNRVFGNYAGGFIPRILKDVDLMQNPQINTYKTLWERLAKEVPVARRFEGKALLDVFAKQVAPSRLPWSRELVLQPPELEYQKLGRWNDNGIWLSSANPQNRMVGKGRHRRPMTEIEADRYIDIVGKGYRELVLKYGDRVLSMPKERAKAFVSDKADEIRDRAAKKAVKST